MSGIANDGRARGFLRGRPDQCVCLSIGQFVYMTYLCVSIGQSNFSQPARRQTQHAWHERSIGRSVGLSSLAADSDYAARDPVVP